MKKILLGAVVVCLCGCANERYEKAAGKTILVYQAAEGSPGDKKCMDFVGTCIVLQTPEPAMQLNGFEFKPHITNSPEKHNQLELLLNREQSLSFEKLSEICVNKGQRIAFVYQNKILHAPKVRTKLQTRGVVLDFCNPQIFKIVLASLRGQLPPAYDFSKDKAWNMCDPSSENK
ncbi:MAG: hypothetical protein WCW52_06730 [Elusimicrobiales bacterium]|jgi:hypothetical protein